MSTQHTRQTFIITAAITGLLVGTPSLAHAQRVQVEVKTSTDVSREIRDALREVTSGIGEAIRDLSRDLGREFGQAQRDVVRSTTRDVGRSLSDVGRSISDATRGLNDVNVSINSNDVRDIARSVTRDVNKSLRGMPDLSRLGAFDGTSTRDQDRNWNSKAEDRQTRTLAIGASGSLELHNLSGDITINATSGREATVEFLRHARGRSDADARLGLDRVKISSEMVGTRGVVKVDYPSDRQAPYSVSVDMIVSAPAGTRVVVNSVSATVKVTGIKGELSITTISGDLSLNNVGAVSDAKTVSGDVHITGSTGDGTLDAGTLSGDVTLTQVKARKITASSVSGNVSTHDVSSDTVSLNSMSGDVSFAGSVAANGRYELSSHSGDVVFSPTGAVGYTVNAQTFNGGLRSSLPIQISGKNSRRQSMSGKVGDGSATVTLTTFSGDIAVGAKGKEQ